MLYAVDCIPKRGDAAWLRERAGNRSHPTKKAYHDYFIEERYECGIELAGTEVKSLRAGKVNLRESYAVIRNGEVFLCGMHISPYEQGNRFNRDPLRDRRLLLHKREIMRLLGYVQQKGLTLVPTELYFSNGRVKAELGVARGKKLFDKRDAIAEKETAPGNRQTAERIVPRINYGGVLVSTGSLTHGLRAEDSRWPL